MKNYLLSKLIIALLMIVGTMSTLSVNAQGYIFVEPADGVVVMEAEHYYSLQEGSDTWSGKSWAVKSDAVSSTYADFSGDGYMQAPDADGGIGDPAEAISVGPSVTYRILFQNTGVYHWYARCSYADWDSDSYHLGGREINATDTVAFEKMNPYTVIGENWNEWGWNYQTASGAKAAFTVTEAGYHEITVLLREPNFRMDKIVLSLDDSYYPWEYPESEDLGRDETAIEGATAVSEIVVSESMEVFPNPVVDNATITYEVLSQSKVNVSVYSLTGELVKVLVDEEQDAGAKQVNWNVAGEATTGIYLVKLTVGGSTLVKKVSVK